jgi:hypothetical protein
MELARREETALQTTEEQVLARMESARHHLAEARTLSDAKRVADGVAAIREWLRKQSDAGLQIINEASLLRLEAERRMGEFLRQPGSVSPGGRPKNASQSGTVSLPTHRALGLNRTQAKRYEEVASVPPEVLQGLAEEATKRGRELTREDVLKVARQVRQREARAAAATVTVERPPYPSLIPAEFRNTVVTGDARQLAARLPEASIAVCFCDPVYSRTEDYEWMARECERVLEPGGSLIVQCGNGSRYECEAAMRRSDLMFVDLLAEVYPYGIGRLFKPKVFVGWKPYLWFSKGPRKTGWVMNRVAVGGKAAAGASKEIHPWGDSEEFAFGLLGKLCDPREVVWDPFTGSGTVPVVAAKLGLPFVAFEISPETAEEARQRVAGTARL